MHYQQKLQTNLFFVFYFKFYFKNLQNKYQLINNFIFTKPNKRKMQAEDIKSFNQKSKQIIQSFSPEIKKFYEFHGVQMLGSQMPVELVETLYHKLQKGVYDAGDYVEITDNEETESYEVKAKNEIKKNSNLFIVDHALTFKYNDLRKALKQNPQMIDRLKAVLKYMGDFKPLQGSQQTDQQQGQKPTSQTLLEAIELEFENMQLTELSHLEFPPNTITLSLMSNQLSEDKIDEILKKLQYLNLKVLWMNDNPVAESEKLREYIDNKTKIQIFNSKFTKHCTPWGLKYAHDRRLEFAYDPVHEHVYQLNLDERNLFAIDLKVLKKFKNLRSLSIKGHSLEAPNAKESLLWILKQIESLRYLHVDLEVEQWLFSLVESKEIQLKVANRVLINKHSLLLQPGPESQDQDIDFITNNVFKIAGCYRLASSEQLDESSTWYINDEVGSMIPHSDDPNVKLIPFLYAPNFKLDSEVQAFSILWPVKDISAGSQLLRDYLNGMKQEKQRSSRLAVWYKLPTAYYHSIIKKYNEKMFELEKNSISVLESFYKQNAVSQRQYIAKISEDDSFFPSKHRVISDHELVLKYLKHDKFEIVDTIEDATIIWLTGAADEEQWKKYKGKYFVNQFPFESSVVMKHNLADTIQTVFGDTKFLQRTYNLEKELKEFVGDYYERETKSEDNLWIIKPPNMARSMDMIISDNLPALIKSMETGPKIAQKYIANPVLRQGRKVDLRYVLLVKSIQPLTLFLYKHFWIRSSNNPYTVDRRALATYETQFTVMNYGNVSDFKQIKYKDFIEEFEKDYSPVQWSTIHDKIKKMLRNTFIAAGIKYPDMQDDKCRAVYGIDIMVDADTMEPKLLEMTFSPDCKRACEYYPTFYDQVFETLFLDVTGQNMERVI